MTVSPTETKARATKAARKDDDLNFLGPCALGRLDRDTLQCSEVRSELGFSRRPAVGFQHECDDVHILLARELARTVERHREADALEQIAQRQVVPIGREAPADER